MDKNLNGKHKDLLENALTALSLYGEDSGTVLSLLKQIVQHFNMDAAFVYTKDYTKGEAFYKQAVFAADKASLLPDEFSINIQQSDFENEELFKKALHDEFIQLMDAAGVAVLPIIDGQRMIGFVGVIRKYSTKKLPEEDKNVLIMMLALIITKTGEEYHKKQKYHARASLEKALDHTGIDIYVTDYYTNEILYVNKPMAAPYGGAEKMAGKKCYEALYENMTSQCPYCPKDELIDENGVPSRFYSWDYQRPLDGSWFRVFSAAFQWDEGRLGHVITSININESKKNELLVTNMAFYDTLTKIKNRRKFEIDFESLKTNVIERGGSGYLLFIDLDNFKYINDAFGHEKGDELLIQVAKYLNSFTDGNNSVYRYGGDEFIFLAQNADAKEVTKLTDTFIKRFANAWDLGDIEYFCTASIGVANYPKDGSTYDDLVTAADMAMYTAKKTGKAAVVFAKTKSNEISLQLEKEFALRKAILNNYDEFTLLYHPFVNTDTGEWEGVEVLPRWHSPQFGTVYPGEFIIMCEKMGLITQFERWVVSTAVEETCRWKTEKNFFISINISTIEFQNNSFIEFLINTVSENDLPPNRLMVEITASARPKYTEEIKAHVDRLRENGIMVALDGFGIGYSSLSSIDDFSVDFIKIDREFIMTFLDDELKHTLVKAVIMIAHAAHARTSAEGVESEAHFEQLKKLGCDFTQGRHFMQPMPAEEFYKKLK